MNRVGESERADLEVIATRLGQKYPSDWYERFWTGPHHFILMFVWGVGFWVWQLSESLMLALAVPLLWQIVAVVLPRLMLGRFAYAPRWAHSAAKLEMEDVHTVNRVVKSMGEDFVRVMAPLLPVLTGDRFWIVLKRVRATSARKRR